MNRILGALLGALVLTGCGSGAEDPREAMRATTMGSILLQEGRLAEAEEEFFKVVEAAPRSTAGPIGLAQVYLLAGRADDADRWVRRALRREPDNVTARLLRAKAFEVRANPARALRELEELAGRDPADPRVLYALVELSETHPAPSVDRADLLTRAVLQLPGNTALRVRLAEALAAAGQPDSALGQLEELGRLWPEPPLEAMAAWRRALDLLEDPAGPDARAAIGDLRRALELTTFYQVDLQGVLGPRGSLAGFPLLAFSPVFDMADSSAESVSAAIRFDDATTGTGLAGLFGRPGAETQAAWAVGVGDYDGDGLDDLVMAGPAPDRPGQVVRLLHNEQTRFADSTGPAGVAGAGPIGAARFADVDNDGHLDLHLAGRTGASWIFRNASGGRFAEAMPAGGLATPPEIREVLWADLDHDGDLDLYLIGAAGPRFFRNNLDGTFRELTGPMGLAGGPGAAAAFGDLDHDGRLDLVVATRGSGAGGPVLYRNLGQQRFETQPVLERLESSPGGVVALGDYDNDGDFDLFAPGPGAGLLRNNGAARFAPDDRQRPVALALEGLDPVAAVFLDYDNDGWLDLVVAGLPRNGERGLFLFRNTGTGTFVDRSELLPPIPATGVVAFDYDADSDLDLLVTGPTGMRLLRNVGGNLNGYVRIQLTALRAGSGKNNTFGIGARIDLRAGPLRQARVVTGQTTLIGLGRLRLADVLRIEWPNGVPQTLSAPTSSPGVREAEALKGSCAFVYPWDGAGYRFLTDVMWRSALGMPLGIMGGRSAWAPAGASQEYVLIPGDRLAVHEGRYRLQLTEELWETAYVDQVQLLVVDHPDSVEVLVNERFVPPEPGRLELYQVLGARPPVAAVDGSGRDVLDRLRHRDDRYVAGFRPGRYQGMVEPHDLILDLGPLAGADSIHLLLNGWIFPTDASINLALSQARAAGPAMPSLAVPDRDGRWITVLPDLGFPAGKSKTVIADLSGKFPAADYRVRIRSGMQVYWDEARVVTGGTRALSRITRLDPVAADLHYRGFSRTYRKGGRYGPHWFDYDQVSTAPRWRPITGAYTRFGDVRPLLLASDDQYAILAPGDEITISFDAAGLPPVAPGWRRDFLLYTDGWIKDADLNTAYGTTVGPLPFHGIRQYPYAPGDAYPTDSARRRYQAEYNTRSIELSRPAP